MMRFRELTTPEREAVAEVIRSAGAVTVLYLVGGIVANDHPDASQGDEYRSLIYRLANKIGADQAGRI